MSRLRYYGDKMKSAAIEALLSKKMTRREFLVYLGTLVLVLSGISGLLQKLTHHHQIATRAKPKHGFGAGPYGG